MKELSNLEEFFEYISQDKLTIIDVYADWCKPCQNFLKIGDRVESALQEKDVVIVKVNFDKNKEIGDAFDVKSVPTFLYFRNGELKMRHSGIKSIAHMLEIIETIN
jgi:thioredoxin 1